MKILAALLPQMSGWIQKIGKKSCRTQFNSIVAFLCNVSPNCALPSKKESIVADFVTKAHHVEHGKRLSTIKLKAQDTFEDLRSTLCFVFFGFLLQRPTCTCLRGGPLGKEGRPILVL